MKKTILAIIIILLIVSCRSIKTKDTSIIKDSINEKTQVTLIKSSVGLAKIQKPCDDDGNLRPIFYESSSGGLKTTVKDENGSILIKQEQKQDTIYKEKLVYKDKLIYKDKIVEVEVTPSWNYKVMGTQTIIILLLLALLFRKKIPLLKFLPF